MAFASLPRMKEPAVGLYGKIPAERDFVRINAGEVQQAGMDQWFAEGIGILHTEHIRLPEEGVQFVLIAPTGDAFVGGFRPGEDGVGRSFPLIISVRLEARKLIEALPLFSSV